MPTTVPDHPRRHGWASDRISLTVPAHGEYARLVRLVATGVAPVTSVEQIERLRFAVGRCVDVLVAAADETSPLQVHVELAGDVVTFRAAVDGHLGTAGRAALADLRAFCEWHTGRTDGRRATAGFAYRIQDDAPLRGEVRPQPPQDPADHP